MSLLAAARSSLRCSRLALARACTAPPPPTTTTVVWAMPQVRHYDRKQYNKEKKRLRAAANQEDITFEEAMDVFRTYCLGEDRIISACIQCEKPEAGVRPTKGDITLPVAMSSEKQAVVLVFAKGGHAEEAKQRGAAFVGGEELIAQVLSGQVTFDKCLSTKEMFPHVIKIAKVLGPKGLMPSPARGTVSDDIASMMASLRAMESFEMDEDAMINLAVARTSWPDGDILKNVRAYVKAIFDARPSKVDASKFIHSINLWAPFAPGIKLPLRPFRDVITVPKKKE